MKVAIVGAGIAGLLTANTFKKAGWEVVVFEKDDAIGGVWAPQNAYDGLTTQNSGHTYTFPSWPTPKEWDPEYFPTAQEYLSYIESFADGNGLRQLVRLRCEVELAAPLMRESTKDVEQGSWLLTVRDQSTSSTSQEYFDFLVICTGMFHTPRLPNFDGSANFTAAGGKVLHSSQVKDLEGLIQDKHVVVLGNGRSGCDLAAACARTGAATSVSQLYRQAKWPAVRYLGKSFLDDRVATRFAYMLLPAYRPSPLRRVLELLFKPVINLFWRSSEMKIRSQLQLEELGVLPSSSLDPAGMGCKVAVAPPDMHTLMKCGSLKPVQGVPKSLSPGQVTLADGRQLTADVIICATGFDSSILDMLPRDVSARVWDPDTGYMRLHNKIVPIGVASIAFVGKCISFMQGLTCEVQAAWALKYAEGDIQLPAAAAMIQMLQDETSWADRHHRPSAAEQFKKGCVDAYTLEYLDILLRDMGTTNIQLQKGSWLREVFGVVEPQMYKPLLDEALAPYTGEALVRVQVTA